MNELAHRLRTAVDTPALDEAELRQRVRRMRARRRVASVTTAVVAMAAAVVVATGIVSGLASDRTVEFADRPGQDRAADAAGSPTWRTLSEAPLTPRWGSVGAWTGTEYLVWGGYANGGSPDEEVADDGAAYDPATRRWRLLPRGPLPGMREAAAAWSGEELWIVGGAGGPNGYQDVLEAAAYDAGRDRWRRLPDPPVRALTAAWSPTAQAVVIGGPGGRGDGLELWTLSRNDTTWRMLPKLPDDAQPAGDDPFVSVVSAGRHVFVVSTRGILVFDLMAPTGWRGVGATVDLDARHYLTATAVDNGLLALVDDQVWQYRWRDSPEDGSWTAVPSPPVTVNANTRVTSISGGAQAVLYNTAAQAGAVLQTDRLSWQTLPPIPLRPRMDAVVIAHAPSDQSTNVFIWGGSTARNLPYVDGALLTN